MTRFALLIEGRVPETVPECGARCGVLRLRFVTAPREVRDTARQALRPGCEELAARVAEEMLQTEARPPAGKSPRWSAEKARVLRHKRVHARLTTHYGTQGASQAPGRATSLRVQPDAAASGRLSALRPPLEGGTPFTTRAPSRRGNG